jgi:hypothetical protein
MYVKHRGELLKRKAIFDTRRVQSDLGIAAKDSAVKDIFYRYHSRLSQQDFVT